MIQMNKRKGFFIEDILNPDFGQNSSKNSNDVDCVRSVNDLSSNYYLNCNVDNNETNVNNNVNNFEDWPSWIYCTRYSDRPSSGPRNRKERKKEKKLNGKRPRTAFTPDQLKRLQVEFEESKYLTDCKRRELSSELDLKESQIKIWFQNKRAKLKKASLKPDT